ncbi:hypothetical protein ACTA71_000309 [Dictyostelium dimigraforme]
MENKIKQNCRFHQNKNLKYICSDLDCKSMPCCSLCITSGGEHHGHKIVLLESITKSEILSITNIFKDEVIPKVIEIFEIDKQTLKDSDNRFKKIQSQYNENKKLVTEQFNKIHKIIQIIQADIEKQLETVYQDNTIINTTITSSINNDNHKNDGVENLKLEDIKQPLEVNLIPASVTSITLDGGFSQPLTPGIIPNSIKQLTLGLINTQLIEGSIPKNIPKIILRYSFNQSLEICKLNGSVEILN